MHLYEQLRRPTSSSISTGSSRSRCGTRRRQRLVLARDRAGIRPLFYTRGAAAACCSPPRSRRCFAAARTSRARSTARARARSSRSGRRSRRDTVFEGVTRLPPGHLLVASSGGAQTLRATGTGRFPSREAPPPTLDRATTPRSCASCSIDAVRLQLRADVPVGAYLSGGLDSSIIAALIRGFTDTPLRTFSLTFEDAEFDESALPAGDGATPRHRPHRRALHARATSRAAFPAADLAHRDADRCAPRRRR